MPETLTPLPRPLCNSGEMMAQKAFVFIIKEEEEGGSDFPANSAGAERESGA